jgi:hypothetical protein
MRKTFARGRMLPQSLSTDPRYGQLSLKARVLYPLIWANCDDQGRITGNSNELKYVVCPNMDDISKEDIPCLVDELETQGFVKLYSTSTRQAVQMLDWWEVQKLQWAWPSDYPAPPGWMDRLRYKKGKKQVVTENWDSGESSPESPPESPPENSPENSPETDVPKSEKEPSRSPLTTPSEEEKQEEKEKPRGKKRRNIISPENSGERSPPKGGPPNKGLFENLLEQIKSAPDGQKAIAAVGELYQVCAGRAPPYSRLGAIAKKVNDDYGYLAKLIWETAGKRPAGDLLDYVDGILRSKKGEEAKDKRGKVHPREDFSGRSW